MKKIDRILFLYILIILEGYVVLSTELLAIRQTIPFIGSGTDTVSIIIAAVLMPLAFGYHAGGRFKPGFKNGRYRSVRDKLIFNILAAMTILLVGLSYVLLNVFFVYLMAWGLDNRLLLATLYSALFLVVPVFLLGQTIPLVSNYFSKKKLSEITGRMLFFSTMGSFMGAVFSTLVLMATIGVHYTAALNFVILAGLVFMLCRVKAVETVFYAFSVMMIAIVLNSGDAMKLFHIVDNNQYNTIAVYEDDNGARHVLLNNSDSSMYDDEGNKHAYVEFAESVAIDPIRDAATPKDILVIGAGAFTFGLGDKNNQYDFVDMDKSLKWVAEDHIIKQKLGENVHFHPLEVRAYFMKSEKKYDLIFLDAYLGDLTLPEHLVTKDFFLQVKKHLKPGGVVMANFIASPNFATAFSRNIDNTFRSVFPHISRHVVGETYDLWNENPNLIYNVIYLHRDQPDADPNKIYTDNKNTVFYDKPRGRK